MNIGLVGRADPANGGGTNNFDAGAGHRQRNGNVQAVRDPVCKVRNSLAHLNVERVIGRNHVLLKFEVCNRLMLKQRRDFLEVQSIKAVEVKMLIADTGQELILPYGFGALSEDGAEALAGARVDPET